jgi:hypothetical protein
VRFSIDQDVDVPPAVAVAAYANPAFYDGRAPRDNISVLEVVSHDDTATPIVIEVRFKFTGSISSAVRAVVDPAKMSWVTRTEVFIDEGRTNWVVLPDHYPDRLSGTGTYRFSEGAKGPGSTVIKVEGDLKVHVPIVGRTVERVIVSGLRSYIAGEVKSLPDVPQG